METKDLICAFLVNQSGTYFDKEYHEIGKFEIIYDKLQIFYGYGYNNCSESERFDLLEYLTFIYNYKQK